MPRVQADVLIQFGQALFQSIGAPVEEASLVARLLVDANLSGHDSHGVIQIPGYIKAYGEGLIAPGAASTMDRETPATALIDGHWGFGHRLAYEAMQLAIDKARQCGVSAVGAYHCYHVGHLGVYGLLAAEAGMVAIIAVNDGGGGQRVVPHGGTAGRLSTNPLAVGLPTGTAEPFILDMSTSVVAEGQVRLKRSRRESMPLGWMIDAFGRPTTDPEDFCRKIGSLLPLGGDVGYKGYGLGLAVDVLAGILGRAGYSRARIPPYNNGLFMVVVDIGRFLGLQEFTAEVRRLVAYIKSCPHASGVDEIVYPGERAAQTRRYRGRHGIEIDSETWRLLRTIAQEHGIQAPDSV
ncbi:MAG TPA: Ldh family oxidoreductase [Candidatus Tectomicrobia bacterium]|nr:Ldh family oxidoreductase [Candidatus Tectomicrobia bacterium]